MFEVALSDSFNEIHEIINKLKHSLTECTNLEIKTLFRLAEEHDEAKLEMFVFLAEFVPSLVLPNKQKLIQDIIDGISSFVSNFNPLTPHAYINECLNVFKSVWNILSPKEKNDFVLKSHNTCFVEVITLKFCQCINLFFIQQKSLLWTLQQVQCFKTMWNKLCNILIMVFDADCEAANEIIICSIKKICNLIEICVNGRIILNGWNFDSYASRAFVCLEVMLGKSTAAQYYFFSNSGIHLMLKWIEFLTKEECHVSKEMHDVIGKIVCVAIRENKHCVQNAVNENAIQILIKYLEKFKHKVIMGVVPALFFLITDSEAGLEIFYGADGISVIKKLENLNNISKNSSLEALTVLLQVLEGQSDYISPADQYVVESNSASSSFSKDHEQSSQDVNNEDNISLKFKTENLTMNTSGTNKQQSSLEINDIMQNNNTFVEENVYSSDGLLYTSAEEVLSSSSVE